MTYLSIVPWILIACWAALVLTWVVTAFGVKRDINRSAWWRFWWVRIILVGVVASLVANGLLRGRVLYLVGFVSPISGNVPLIVLAVALCFFGIALAIWARLHLGRNWSPAPALKEEHELVTSGPYRLIRHPIYTGIILAMLGSALASPAWLVVLVIFTVMFVWRVHVEEKLMMQQFPDTYPQYKKRTWALVPYVW